MGINDVDLVALKADYFLIHDAHTKGANKRVFWVPVPNFAGAIWGAHRHTRE